MARLSELAQPLVLARKVSTKLAIEKRRREADARRALLLQFESLGENCELGFVQQVFDAHPLGLFRWSGISLPDLVAALDTDLQGVGEPEHTEIYWDDTFGEYYYRDLRYGMHTHTRMFRKDHPEDKARQLLQVRTLRLCEKLLEDIREAEKIFVFQAATEPAPDEMRRLFGSLQRFNPASKLLFVSAARDAASVGAVRQVEPGLMAGGLDRVGFDGSRRPHWRISYQPWLSILAAAARCCGRRVPRAATADVSGLDIPESF